MSEFKTEVLIQYNTRSVYSGKSRLELDLSSYWSHTGSACTAGSKSLHGDGQADVAYLCMFGLQVDPHRSPLLALPSVDEAGGGHEPVHDAGVPPNSREDDNKPLIRTIMKLDKYVVFWSRVFEFALAPRPHSSRPDKILFWVVGHIFVTPFTNLTGLSLWYQLYLDRIFHRGPISRIGHYMCMPVIVWCTMMWLTQWRVDGTSWNSDQREVLVFQWTGGAVFAIILAVWWYSWGFLSGHHFLGLGSSPVLLTFYVTSSIIFQLTRPMKAADIRWYCPTYNAGYNPFMWMILMAFFQSVSHAGEAFLPPRVTSLDPADMNSDTRWVGLQEYMARKDISQAEKYFVIGITAVFGTLDEWIASPRLLPLMVTKIWYMLGYMSNEYDVLCRISEVAIASEQPSLDWIGNKGGATLRVHGGWRLCDATSDKPVPVRLYTPVYITIAITPLRQTTRSRRFATEYVDIFAAHQRVLA